MKKFTSFLNILVLILFISSFSNAQTRVVSYDKSGEHDFSKYKTFGFYKLDLGENVTDKGVIPGSEVLKKSYRIRIKYTRAYTG